MALSLSQGYKNLPANCTEMSALKELLDDDFEHRSFILRRQEKVQARYTYAKKASEVLAACLATTSAVKDAYAASILSTKSLENALKNALNMYDDHRDILATISSTKGMLATWAETVALTEALLTHLDKSTAQVETYLHLTADEHAAHESAHIAASGAKHSCTDMLRAVDGSIAKTKGALFGLRNVPTEILPRIFIEAVDAR
jgi:septation ring formation regulator EzrA